MTITTTLYQYFCWMSQLARRKSELPIIIKANEAFE